MDKVAVKVKRWGSSLGVVIPADVVRRNHLAPGDTLEIRLAPKTPRVSDLVAFMAGLSDELKDFDFDAARRELETGWDDD